MPNQTVTVGILSDTHMPERWLGTRGKLTIQEFVETLQQHPETPPEVIHQLAESSVFGIHLM